VIVGAILLLLVAAALVAAELFLPSHGLMGLLAVLCALGSVILAARVSPLWGAVFAFVAIIATPLVFYWTVRLYPKSPMGKRVMLDAPQPAANDMFNEESQKLQHLVGQRGVAMTLLRPAGSVDLNGNRIDCVSEAEVIDPGTRVEVIRVSGQKVIVKAVA